MTRCHERAARMWVRECQRERRQGAVKMSIDRVMEALT
jgi:hypothetical protein